MSLLGNTHFQTLPGTFKCSSMEPVSCGWLAFVWFLSLAYTVSAHIWTTRALERRSSLWAYCNYTVTTVACSNQCDRTTFVLALINKNDPFAFGTQFSSLEAGQPTKLSLVNCNPGFDHLQVIGSGHLVQNQFRMWNSSEFIDFA